MKLIVSDLDGTLLNSKQSISKENINAISYAKERDVEFAIASARIYFDVLNICKKSNLSTHIISNNGACVYSKEGKILFEKAIEIDILTKLLQYLENNSLSYQISTSNNVFMNTLWEEILVKEYNEIQKSALETTQYCLDAIRSEILSQSGLCLITDYSEFLEKNEPCYNISVVSFRENIMEQIKNEFAYCIDKLSITPSGKSTFEIMCQGCTKGQTLSYLADYLNINKSEIIGIGDNLNDETLLKNAGIGIAMGNANEYIKKISDFVSVSNDENGVAYAIYHFIEK